MHGSRRRPNDEYLRCAADFKRNCFIAGCLAQAGGVIAPRSSLRKRLHYRYLPFSCRSRDPRRRRKIFRPLLAYAGNRLERGHPQKTAPA